MRYHVTITDDEGEVIRSESGLTQDQLIELCGIKACICPD
jgi:hypothetical protein